MVYIDPRCRINYASYYILGLITFYGKKSIKFDVHRFTIFEPLNTEQAQANGMCFMLSNAENRTQKPVTIYIDFRDSDTINFDVYHCIDVYAKVNLNPSYGPEKHPKIIPIGPSFAIDIWSWLDTLYYGLRHVLTSRNHLKLKRLNFFKDYLYLKLRRRPLSDYHRPVATEPDYLFFMSTLWFDQQTAATTNSLRGRFLRIGQKCFRKFEGGFFYVKSKISVRRFPAYESYLEEYKDCIYHRRIDMATYITKTKRSVVVFNTPSVSGCLGWKLGEYLCMGKAIISYPLDRIMPNETAESSFAHFVGSDDQLEEAVALLKKNERYRHQLEQSAATYFHEYLSPAAVIKRIVDHISVQNTE